MNNPEIFKFKYYVEFNNKVFAVLSSKQTRLYLLEYDKNNNSFKYPSFEDYLEYFNTHTKLSTVLASGTINKVNNTEMPKNKLFRLIPKVFFRGAFVSVATALLMTGCAVAPDNNADKNPLDNGYVYSPDFVPPDIEPGYSLASTYEDDFVNEFYFKDFNSVTIFCEDMDHVREQLEIEEATYDDVIELFKTKEGLSEEQREAIINGLNNMKTQMPNFDVSVLYHNANKMRFYEVTQDEINNQFSFDGAVACYNYASNTVYYNPNNPDYTDFAFLHETLGHGSLELLDYNNDNKRVFYSYQTVVNDLTGDSASYTRKIGTCFSEGGADYIAQVASGTRDISNYEYATESMCILSELMGVPMDELLNQRGSSFYKQLHEKANIDNPIELTMDLDQVLDDYYNFKVSGNKEYLNNVFTDLYVDYSEEKVEENGLSEITKTRAYIANDGTAALRYGGAGSYSIVAQYDKDKVADNVERELTDIYNKTR